ncbi:MAG: hypothetical protein QM817_20495 [Archangium sp.]
MNEIVEVKTVQAGPPHAPIFAIMIAANVRDATKLAALVAEVVEKFKAQRMASPPTTSHFLFSVRGATTASAIKSLWDGHVLKDGALAAFIGALSVADLVRAGPSGPAVETVSLLLS